MRIVRTTPDVLVIEDRPWFLWITLPVLGAPTVVAAFTGQVDGFWTTLLVGAIGLGVFWFMHHFAPFQRFTFERETATFIHDVYRVTGHKRWTVPLGDIERAAEQAQWSDGTRLERVALITKDGKYPLESGFSNRRAQPTIDAINAWLTQSP